MTFDVINHVFICFIDELRVRLEGAEVRISQLEYHLAYYQQMMQQPLVPYQYSQYNPYREFMAQSPSFTQSVSYTHTDYNQQGQLYNQQMPTQGNNRPQGQLYNQQMPTQGNSRPSASATTEKWTNQSPLLVVSSRSGNYLPSSAIP